MKMTNPAEMAGYCGENNKAPRFYLGALNLFHLRREQDSNLRTGFAGYTLSRRASSTTRAPLLLFLRLQNYKEKREMQNISCFFYLFFSICTKSGTFSAST